MPYFLAPESLRARWSVEIPASDRAAVENIVAIVRVGPRPVHWGLEGVQLLMLAGDEPTIAIPTRTGIVLARGGADPKGAKWKKLPGLRLPVTGPMALFDFASPALGVPVTLALGDWSTAWDTNLVKLSR